MASAMTALMMSPCVQATHRSVPSSPPYWASSSRTVVTARFAIADMASLPGRLHGAGLALHRLPQRFFDEFAQRPVRPFPVVDFGETSTITWRYPGQASTSGATVSAHRCNGERAMATRSAPLPRPDAPGAARPDRAPPRRARFPGCVRRAPPLYSPWIARAAPG